ncbi:MAG TPA: isopentenyl phosphate kinase [Thermoanaerobaculia bacterium]|nr:isopentenyl phosphate kinase [Thermoanaerobaculia bacterium]
MGEPSEVTLVKLGGSLLTDKTAVDAVRPAILARLAAEIAASAVPALVLAHGSGSFGHVAARRYGLAAGLRHGGGQLPGVSLTQERAAALHWQVCAALAAAGLHPFSLAPSSSVVADGGRPLAIAVEPLLLALAHGLLPVLYGDVVLDRLQGVAICSTERLFDLLASELRAHGVRVRRVLWLGETDGVYDAAGRTLPRLDAGEWARRGELRGAIGGAAGTDVTGGMLHRVETALALAARGIPSLIANGTTPGLLAAALRGEPVPGTEIGS